MAEANSSAQKQQLVITLKRSMIGTPLRHRLVLRGLRLRRPNQSVTLPDSPQVRGMIQKVNYLLEVTHQ
ncbi:MAG: 50S ribosomal protein L30 [Nitrospiraceae bacterium]